MRQCTPVLLLAVLPGLAACGSTGTSAASSAPTSREYQSQRNNTYRVEAVSPTITRADEVAAPIYRIWALLPEVFQELGVGGGVIDPAGFVYGQRELTLRRRLGNAALSQFVECGSSAGISTANSYTVTLSVVTQLQRTTPESTGVLSQVRATARQPGHSSQTAVCSSTTELERRILNGIKLRLAS